MQSTGVQPEEVAVLANNSNNKSLSAQTLTLSNPVIAHWRGCYPLAPTLVITLIGLRLFLGFVQASIPVAIIDLWLVMSVGVFFWQAVGTSRSADKFVKYTGSILGVMCAYVTLFVAAMMTLMQVADAIASRHTPVAYSTVYAGQLKTNSRPMVNKEGVLRVDGNLDWELFGAFEQTLAENPGVKSVLLGSAGGYVFVARAMALQILDRSLDTLSLIHI